MNPFEPGGPEIPPAPIDIPTPDIPAADFVEIGKQAAAGMAKGGLLDQWAQKLLDLLAQAVGIILAALVGLVEWVLAQLLAIVIRALTANEAATNQIAATVVGGMTGRPYSPGAFSNAEDSGARDEVSVNLIRDIQAAIATGQGAANGTGITPTSAGAEAFLKLTSHMAVEGWLIGWLADAFSVHELEQLGSLKDSLEAALGLGRLARRALAAPMKILCEDPYTYLLNTQYRPTLPGVDLLVRQYLRGIVTRPQLDGYMGYHGYQNTDVEALINFNRAHLSPGDIETLRLHGSLDDNAATAALKAQGYDDATAASILFALSLGRHDTWARLLVQDALRGVETRQITLDDFDGYVKGSGLPDDEKQILELHSRLRLQLSRKRFSIAEGEALVKKGLWTLDQFRQLATDLGYTSDDETVLELMLLVEIKDAADAATKKAATAKAKADAAAAKAKAAADRAAQAQAAAEAKGLSLARFETLVTDGLRTIADYTAFLVGKGIAADNRAALVTALQNKLDTAQAAQLARPGLAAGAKAKNLDLAQLETAVKDGSLTIAEFETKLQAIGFTPEDTQLLAADLQSGIDAVKVKADAQAAAKAKAKTKGVDLAQLQRGVRLGLLTIDDYAARLAALGFNSPDSDLLVAEMQAQLQADAQAKQTKAAVAQGLQGKGLSLAQLEQAVRAGVLKIADYRAALAKAGYNAAAQDQLVSLLQLRIDQDQQTLATKGHASALLAQVGLSLADIERAVKLGVVPLTIYSDALSKAGVSHDDAQVLTLSLAAQVKATKTAQQTLAAAAKSLKLAGVDLAKLEKDVIAGSLSIQQFQGVLEGGQVSAADVKTIVQLVSDELANAQHIATLEGQVGQAAASKGLSLAQEKEAVIAGVKTIDDYRAFVTGLNFSSADVETLTATLAEKLQAKPGKAPPPPPGGVSPTLP